MNSQRIFVTGEVTHTGPMPLLPHMTVLQALSQAGFTQFANVKNIYLLRTENGKQVKIPFNYKEVVKGRHPEQNIMLKPGDTIVVPVRNFDEQTKYWSLVGAAFRAERGVGPGVVPPTLRRTRSHSSPFRPLDRRIPRPP